MAEHEAEIHNDSDLETLSRELCDDEVLMQYKAQFDDYRTSWFPKLMGGFLVWCGNFVYGKKPSYLKFRAVEVIARVPYQSWSSAAYTLLTLFYTNEEKAIDLSDVTHYARHAQDNETMHVVVISQLAEEEEKAGIIRHTVIPMLFAFFYFWSSYLMYLVNPKYSLELNYLFEAHAFDQYDRFLDENKEELKDKRVESDFLHWYGRNHVCQYDFFQMVRNDELIHRNRSIRDIEQIEANKLERKIVNRE